MMNLAIFDSKMEIIGARKKTNKLFFILYSTNILVRVEGISKV